ncbi:hypothetical protein NPIL_204231 [Nephila pilipes]|uniref:Uncharacterized protein n=1 Tax=Nephila pilipes TaxID=299642 RepID=A0A8X6PR53_NEPPI|nr:hypothetical protein NPIL_204231 [Nephila pilipes]
MKAEYKVYGAKQGANSKARRWRRDTIRTYGNFVVIGSKTQYSYIDTLKEKFFLSAEKLDITETYKFEQNNIPKHLTLNTLLCMLYNCPKVIKTAAQSLDLNPIEHLWSYVENRLFKRQFPS